MNWNPLSSVSNPLDWLEPLRPTAFVGFDLLKWYRLLPTIEQGIAACSREYNWPEVTLEHDEHSHRCRIQQLDARQFYPLDCTRWDWLDTPIVDWQCHISVDVQLSLMLNLYKRRTRLSHRKNVSFSDPVAHCLFGLAPWTRRTLTFSNAPNRKVRLWLANSSNLPFPAAIINGVILYFVLVASMKSIWSSMTPWYVNAAAKFGKGRRVKLRRKV